ncbi:S1C family serine protease [Ferroacidibacillus organovorans]|uniref:PDZ domain-containing protein n=1 Tax=Ferroacidibacillus organovorans TaxID=1765683 RepID=A0A162U4Q4_9BACL|nr:trypsin-like peptidase domain-containing protein [Ferroacidibacillus organovorans]KYP81398.1 hypothetical protein AYJ22_01135 [Ferroacidibacillus organovorans]OAG95185.1 hypothetical protein AYW79_01735 [Ferroacidibacillus organovorans]OPG15178.1 hypothetical protein B2M26_13590 [Ferroacidibacillus organovorans]
MSQSTYRKLRRRVKRRVPLSAVIALTVLSASIGAGSTLLTTNLVNTTQAATLNNSKSAQAIANMSYTTPPAATQTVNVSVSDGIVSTVKKATPTVVGVLNMQNQPNANGVGMSLQEAAIGSGVIISSAGYIVTNNHVVEGANQVQVVIDQRKRVIASVVGTDPYTDLAVLKVPASDITAANVAVLGNSNTLQVGEPDVVIGNPAGLQFADTATAGIISATQRTMPVQDELTGQTLGNETVLQTDAAINPGNSGGPVLNILGQVVGIASSKIAAQNFSGMGFAIPINTVKKIVNQILTSGHAQHAALGISGASLSNIPSYYSPNVPVTYGVWVDATDNPNAKAAGIQHGDIIVAVNGKKVTGLTSLQNILANYMPGQDVQVTIYRGSKKLVLTDKLSNLPPLQIQGNGSGPVVG